MNGFTLRQGLSFCRLEGHMVFLDLEADRYFGLQPALAQAFTALVDSEKPDPRGLRALLAARILICSTESNRPAACARTTTPRALGPINGVDAPMSDVVSALIRRLVWRARLRTMPFARNMHMIGHRKRALSSGYALPSTVARMHQAYLQASRILSSRDQCLATSLSLASWLIALNVRPDLILGVKLNPFQAHCWVEVGGAVVGDEPEQVQPFTPIWIE